MGPRIRRAADEARVGRTSDRRVTRWGPTLRADIRRLFREAQTRAPAEDPPELPKAPPTVQLWKVVRIAPTVIKRRANDSEPPSAA